MQESIQSPVSDNHGVQAQPLQPRQAKSASQRSTLIELDAAQLKEVGGGKASADAPNNSW